MKIEIGFDVHTTAGIYDVRFLYDLGKGPHLQVGERLEFSADDADLVLIIDTLFRDHTKEGIKYRADAEAEGGNPEDIRAILETATPFVSDVRVRKDPTPE